MPRPLFAAEVGDMFWLPKTSVMSKKNKTVYILRISYFLPAMFIFWFVVELLLFIDVVVWFCHSILLDCWT
jgi:hypothetical protein